MGTLQNHISMSRTPVRVNKFLVLVFLVLTATTTAFDDEMYDYEDFLETNPNISSVNFVTLSVSENLCAFLPNRISGTTEPDHCHLCSRMASVNQTNEFFTKCSSCVDGYILTVTPSSGVQNATCQTCNDPGCKTCANIFSTQPLTTMMPSTFPVTTTGNYSTTANVTVNETTTAAVTTTSAIQTSTTQNATIDGEFQIGNYTVFSDQVCTSCYDGYSLNSNGKCVMCNFGCLKCTLDGNDNQNSCQ